MLERRSEIGLRRSLGATRRDVRLQFLAEAILLTALCGVAIGTLATTIYAHIKSWATVVPPLTAAVAIGAIAGLLPAIRAARMQPTEALRTV